MLGASDSVLFHKEGPVAHLTLNRPNKFNAFNTQMRDQLYVGLEAIRDDPEISITVISGAGSGGFCSGADLSEFGTAPSQVVARGVRWERDLWGMFAALHKPIVASLHGHVIGSGLEIASLCDIRVASEDVTFRMPEVALGMLPAAGGTQTLTRLLGITKTLEIMFMDRVFGAKEALGFGLVNVVVDRKSLDERVRVIANRLASLDQDVVQLVKKLVCSGADMPLREALDLEHRIAGRPVDSC